MITILMFFYFHLFSYLFFSCNSKHPENAWKGVNNISSSIIKNCPLIFHKIKKKVFSREIRVRFSPVLKKIYFFTYFYYYYYKFFFQNFIIFPAVVIIIVFYWLHHNFKNEKRKLYIRKQENFSFPLCFSIKMWKIMNYYYYVFVFLLIYALRMKV